jgi:hypothetical protein
LILRAGGLAYLIANHFKGKEKVWQITGGNVWSRVDSPLNMAEDKKSWQTIGTPPRENYA